MIRRSFHVQRVTAGGLSLWEFSVVGWGDAVHGYCRSRTEAVRVARRSLVSLSLYFRRYYEYGKRPR